MGPAPWSGGSEASAGEGPTQRPLDVPVQGPHARPKMDDLSTGSESEYANCESSLWSLGADRRSVDCLCACDDCCQ